MTTLSNPDLLSIEEARSLAVQARDAQRVWGKATQAQVDKVCEAMAEVAYRASERLGRMAAEETGFTLTPRPTNEAISWATSNLLHQPSPTTWYRP